MDLQGDREDVPEHDAVADRQVDLAGHHRDHRGQRQQRDHRLVAQDRAQVEQRRKGVGQQQREQQDQQRRSGSPGRRPASGARCAGRATASRSSARVGSSAVERIDCMRAPPARSARVRRCRPRRRGGCASTERSSPVELGDDPAAAEHQGAVADVGDFLEIGGDDHEDGQPALQRGVEQPVDLGLGADVDAGGRLLEDQQLAADLAASGRSPPSAGCRRTGSRSAARVVRPQPNRPHERCAARPVRRPGAASQQAAAAGGGVEEQVLAHAQRHRQALAGAVAGDEADAGAHGRRRGVRGASVAPCQRDACRHRSGEPNRARPICSCPAPRRPDQAQHLAGAQRQGDRADVADAGRRARAPSRPAAVCGRTKTCSGGRPTIMRSPARAASSSATGLRADQPAVAQHRHLGRRSRTPRPADARHRSCRHCAPRSRRSTANRRSTSSAGRLAVGSSSTMISASTASARAIATSDFSVRVRLPTRASGSMSPPTRGQRLARAPPRACRQSIRPSAARKAQAHRHVLGDRHPVDQAEILVDEGDRSGARRPRPGGAGSAGRGTGSRPRRARWMPASILISVDLPAPFSPSSARISPACRSRLT